MAWWSQGVTVGYERARGMRARNQRPGQGFEVSVSKTVDMPTLEAWRAFVEPKRRAEWLDLAYGCEPALGRWAAQPGSMSNRRTRVNVYFDAKGERRPSSRSRT